MFNFRTFVTFLILFSGVTSFAQTSSVMNLDLGSEGIGIALDHNRAFVLVKSSDANIYDKSGYDPPTIYTIDLSTNQMIGAYALPQNPIPSSIAISPENIWIGTSGSIGGEISFQMNSSGTVTDFKSTNVPVTSEAIFGIPKNVLSTKADMKAQYIGQIMDFKKLITYLPKKEDREFLSSPISIAFENNRLFATFQQHNLTKPGYLAQIGVDSHEYVMTELPGGPNQFIQYIFPVSANYIGVSIPAYPYHADQGKNRAGGISIYNLPENPTAAPVLSSFAELPGIPGHALYDKINNRFLVCDIGNNGRFFVMEEVDTKLASNAEQVNLFQSDTSCVKIAAFGKYVFVVNAPRLIPVDDEQHMEKTMESDSVLNIYNRADLSPVCQLSPTTMQTGVDAMMPIDLAVDESHRSLMVLFETPSILTSLHLNKDGLPLLCN